jgi:hypothetical protein
MPTDQFIEDITDGSPSEAGDRYALQRRVSGVWRDYFIKAENIAGSGVLTADVTITGLIPNSYPVLPQVSGKCYIILEPPLVQITGNTPTLGTGNFHLTDSSGTQQWLSQITDSETDANYVMATRGLDFAVGSTDLNFVYDVFFGADARIRFAYVLADI